MMDVIVGEEIYAPMLTDKDEVVDLMLGLFKQGLTPFLEITLPYYSHPFESYGELLPVTKELKSKLNRHSILDKSQCAVNIPDMRRPDFNSSLVSPSDLTFIENLEEPDLIRIVLCGNAPIIICGSTILEKSDVAFLVSAGIIPEIKTALWPGNQYTVII